jgi:hypothetical protein
VRPWAVDVLVGLPYFIRGVGGTKGIVVLEGLLVGPGISCKRGVVIVGGVVRVHSPAVVRADSGVVGEGGHDEEGLDMEKDGCNGSGSGIGVVDWFEFFIQFVMLL